MKRDNHHLYDNLKKKHISKNVTAQIVSCVYYPGPQLIIPSKSAQQQGNGFDCGVYAIVSTASLTCGGNPEKESYDKKRLDRT